MNLADWGPISPDSAMPGYTGPSTDTLVDQDDPSKYVTRDYYEQQLAQFQAMLINLDQQAQTFAGLLADPTFTDPADRASVQGWLNDYQAKKLELQATAKAVNAVVTTANAFGVGLLNITLPTTLSQWQPVAIIGVAAAVYAVTQALVWGAEYIAKAVTIAQAIKTLPPDKLQAVLDSLNKGTGDTGTLGSLANIIKWGAIAAMVWFGYKAFTEYGGHHAGAEA